MTELHKGMAAMISEQGKDVMNVYGGEIDLAMELCLKKYLFLK